MKWGCQYNSSQIVTFPSGKIYIELTFPEQETRLLKILLFFSWSILLWFFTILGMWILKESLLGWSQRLDFHDSSTAVSPYPNRPSVDINKFSFLFIGVRSPTFHRSRSCVCHQILLRFEQVVGACCLFHTLRNFFRFMLCQSWSFYLKPFLTNV